MQAPAHTPAQARVCVLHTASVHTWITRLAKRTAPYGAPPAVRTSAATSLRFGATRLISPAERSRSAERQMTTRCSGSRDSAWVWRPSWTGCHPMDRLSPRRTRPPGAPRALCRVLVTIAQNAVRDSTALGPRDRACGTRPSNPEAPRGVPAAAAGPLPAHRRRRVHVGICPNVVGQSTAEHNGRIPHSAFKGQTPDEMYFGKGEGIPDRLEAARQEARAFRLEANRARRCGACG